VQPVAFGSVHYRRDEDGYAIGGRDDNVVMEAFVAFFGLAEEQCLITGSDPSAFTCRAARSKKTCRELFASFDIERRG
jgi:hypothetical protein